MATPATTPTAPIMAPPRPLKTSALAPADPDFEADAAAEALPLAALDMAMDDVIAAEAIEPDMDMDMDIIDPEAEAAEPEAEPVAPATMDETLTELEPEAAAMVAVTVPLVTVVLPQSAD